MKTITGIILLTSLVLAPVVRAENAADLQKLMTTGDCVGCDLQDADLRNLDLRGANLEDANLINSKLHNTNLSRANLKELT